jgi:hypothetical protein
MIFPINSTPERSFSLTYLVVLLVVTPWWPPARSAPGEVCFFLPPAVVSDLLSQGDKDMAIGDFDGDQDLDVAIAVNASGAEPTEDALVWIENIDAGNQWAKFHVIARPVGPSKFLESADLDADTDPDLLYLRVPGSEDSGLVCRLNLDGTGAFGEEILIDATPSGSWIQTGDVDGDGLVDIVTSGGSAAFRWYRNAGVPGVFESPLNFGTAAMSTGGAELADLDGDEKLDLAIAFQDRVDWWRNIGLTNGVFEPAQSVALPGNSPENPLAADVDHDDNPDLVFTSNGILAWLENQDGLGQFGGKQEIHASADPLTEVVALDVNGDGFRDLCTAQYKPGPSSLLVFHNIMGTGTFQSPIEIPIPYGLIYSLQATDLNSDQTPDLVYTDFRNYLTWYPMQGSSLDMPRSVSSGDAGILHLDVADLDGDGDKDLITSAYRYWSVGWYENLDGRGTFGAQHVISCTVTSATCVAAGDLDNDGDVDVAITASESVPSFADYDLVAWFENTGGENPFATRSPLPSAGTGVSGIQAADFDLDGDLDIVSSASAKGVNVSWMENSCTLPLSVRPASSGESIEISWSGSADFNYALEYTPLGAGVPMNWTLLVSGIPGTNSVMSCVDSNASAAPSRAYRIQVTASTP